VQLFQAAIFLLLVPDVFPYQGLVPPDGRHEKPPSPEALTDEVSSLFSIHARQVNGTLFLDEADHLRNRIFRRNRDHHVHVIRQQMPLLDPAFLLRSQLAEHFPKMPSQLSVQTSSSCTWE